MSVTLANRENSTLNALTSNKILSRRFRFTLGLSQSGLLIGDR
ncbi:MAG: hypothetical protein RMZ41_006725 [Nostoc sp. DedVER02]|nr:MULTISPECIES: hypothetical protein [unclassified Nostoc]MDZ7985956.1 hypothetical protein [Nostoc sp. DedVER02]MDZ8111485.1 hypothetical protein [Nostoc sp. DedVER01b]